MQGDMKQFSSFCNEGAGHLSHRVVCYVLDEAKGESR